VWYRLVKDNTRKRGLKVKKKNSGVGGFAGGGVVEVWGGQGRITGNGYQNL
jgi:hypothetical protein